MLLEPHARRDNIRSTVNAKGMLIMTDPVRPITLDDLRGQPGLSRAASDALVAQQPPTVLKALVMHGVGRKTTQRLLALGLLTDPEGVQTRSDNIRRVEGDSSRGGNKCSKALGRL